jgi:dihydropyrimidinase
MLDLAITGGTCVLPTGTQAADIGVKDGRIALVGGPGSLPAAARTVSAHDRLVIPGGIDPHIHCLMPVRAPGRPDVLTDPPSQVSKAALHGGTTTLIDFVQCVHDRTIQESIEQTQGHWKAACYCDYGYHLTLMGEVPTPHFGQLADAMQDGHASIKIFTTNIRPGNLGRMVPHGHIWEALKVVAAAGGIACIHAEDNDIVMFMYEKLMRENRVSFEHMAEVHNALSEELSFNRVIRLAENVEGAALYMVHVSAATGVAALEASRRRGFPMYGETLHQYLLYNAEDYKRPGGQMFHTYPSLKYPEDQKRLWTATNRGAIQVIATDELTVTGPPLVSVAVGFIRARSSRLTIPRVASFRRRCSEITSHVAKNSSFEGAAATPSARACSSEPWRPQASTFIPNALPKPATTAPIRP